MAVSDTDKLQSKLVDLDHIWAVLKDGICMVYRDVDIRDAAWYTEPTGCNAGLYTLVYRFCVSECHGATNAGTNNSKEGRGRLDWSPGLDLCERLNKFLEDYLGSLLGNRSDLESADIVSYYSE
ncbi:cullin-1-like [Haemaphysalis longicornis]